MKPKLEDVAKHANVSKTTVSRVLNNRGYLSQKTIDRVYQAMHELNYQPNAIARQLFKKETNLIGLLFPTVANPFFGELVEALERRLYQAGYKVIIGNSQNDPAKERDYLNQLLAEQVDGLIVGTHNQGIQEYAAEGLPIVAIDRVMNQDIPVVESDNYAGGVLATERLIEQGARHILHVNGPETLETPAQRRRTAYEDTMRAHQLTPLTVTIDFNLPLATKKAFFHQVLRDHPQIEAIFASNDIDATLIWQAAQEIGRHIPADLRLIGYDGTQLLRHIYPHLTTIQQPIEQMAETAIQILTKRLQQEPTPSESILPVTLWPGQSG